MKLDVTVTASRVTIDSHSERLTAEQAAEFVSRFPKSYRAHRTQLITYANGVNYQDGSVAVPYISFSAFEFTPNGVTGTKNESAVKRLRSVLAKLDTMHDVELIETSRFSNVISLSELLATI